MQQIVTLITTLSEDRAERIKQLGAYGADGWWLASDVYNKKGEREGTFQCEINKGALSGTG